jgi:hypothetical protein
MSSIVIQGDTSGSITLAAPLVAGSNTITLPAATGTAMVSGNMPAFSAYRSSSNQSFSTSTWTKVQLNSEEFDTNNCFDSTTNYRFTPTVAGYYQFSGAIAFSGTVGRSLVSFWKNGAEYKTGIDLSTGVIKLNTSALIYCNGTTDYVELYGYCVGVSLAFDANQQATYMTGALVRAA